MPRQPRKNIKGNYFHLMVQGIGRDFIFLTDEQKGYYLSSLKKARNRSNVKILAFCVMGNHAHIMLAVKKYEELSLFMNYANAEYARYYNRINKRIGYVFRDRFRAEVIENEKYLVQCMAYIHNNPVKANIVQKAEEYRFSSYVDYLEQKGIVDFDEAANYYDTSPKNIKAIMWERSSSFWIEHDDKMYEEADAVLEEMLKKHHVSSAKELLNTPKILMDIVDNLQVRSGISLRKTAALLGFARETFRKILLETKKDA